MPDSELIVGIKADNTDFNRKLKESEKNAKKFADQVGNYTRVLASLATGFYIKNKLDAIGKLADAAEGLNVSANALKNLQLAASESGVSADQLNQSLNFMQNVLGNISTNTNAQDVLAKIGVSARELKLLAPEEQLKTLAAGVASLSNQEDKASAARTLFGRAGQKQLAFLKSDIDSAINKYKELGLALSDSDVLKLDAAGDTRQKFLNIIDAIGQQFAVILSGPLNGFSEWLTTTITRAGGLNNIFKEWGNTLTDTFNNAKNTANSLFLYMDKLHLQRAEVKLDNFNKGFDPESSTSAGANGIQELKDYVAKRKALIDDVLQTRSRIQANSGIENNTAPNAVTNLQKNIEDNRSPLAMNVLASTAIHRVAQQAHLATKEFKALTAATKTQTNAFSSFFNGGNSSQLINDIIKGSDPKQNADSQDFKDTASEIVNKVNEGLDPNDSFIKERFKRLQSQIGFDAREGYNVSGEVQALNELRKFVDATKDKQQEVLVTIQLDKAGFVQAAIEQTSFKNAVIAGAKEAASQEARKVAR